MFAAQRPEEPIKFRLNFLLCESSSKVIPFDISLSQVYNLPINNTTKAAPTVGRTMIFKSFVLHGKLVAE